MTNYPNLFSPLQVKGLRFQNRMFSAPMGAHSLTAEGYLTAEAVDFYEILAKGGVAMVNIGETLVHSKSGNNHGRVLRLDDPGVLPSLLRCTDAIHRYGTYASIELLHPGRRADPLYNENNTTYGPSGGFAHYGDGEHEVTELTEEMIGVIVNAFGDAAEMAKLGGCDMVMVHAGHGWLLNQFLSPANNQRTDRFGGSIENRARILLMVAENIREKCGKDFVIDFRVSGDDFMEGGATLADLVEVAKLLESKIDMLHVSATSFHNRRASIRMFPSMFYERGCNAFLAEEIKKHVSIPVATVGAFNDPGHMERMIAENRVDFIAMARALLADPMLPEKARLGKADDIVYCVRCNNCMSAGFVPYVKYPLGVSHCSVNPWHGLITEYLHGIKPMGAQKVLIAGGGPAGMEAALGAAECGHSVVLCEKSGSLGGALKHAWHPAFKQDVKRFVEVLERRIRADKKIELRLNTAVTPELVREIGPDALIVAIGGKPAKPPIPGVEDPRVISALALHESGVELGKRVVFIGGGLVGCEEGIALAQAGDREVTILEMTDRLATGATYVHYISVLNVMEQLDNLHMELNCRCTAITPEGVRYVNGQGEETLIQADTVVLSTGIRALAEETSALRDCAPCKVTAVGDCASPAQMAQAVLQGYFAGYHLQRL